MCSIIVLLKMADLAKLVKKLYLDMDGPAAFSNPAVIQKVLKEHGLKVSRKRVENILKSLPSYSKFYKRSKKLPRLTVQSPVSSKIIFC